METLNLHGMGLDEALQKTCNSIQWCLQHGVDILDINHGKGHHSERNFSVIKSEVRKMLKTLPEIKAAGYKVVYGEWDLPVCLTFDAGHTLVLIKGLEHQYLGGKKVQEKNLRIYSAEARRERKAAKARKALKRKR
ncbi:MAG: Smr/MutS family protein [Syntrophomonadaceae bacterium]|nr:Smr/MutS family protein [Syntrophomonadaceae bacterium]